MKYIFIKDVHLVTKSKKLKYSKNSIVELTQEKVKLFTDLNAIKEYKMTVKDLKEELDKMGISYNVKAKKSELEELYVTKRQ